MYWCCHISLGQASEFLQLDMSHLHGSGPIMPQGLLEPVTTSVAPAWNA